MQKYKSKARNGAAFSFYPSPFPFTRHCCYGFSLLMVLYAFQHLLSIFNRRRRQLPVSLPRCCCCCGCCCCCCSPTNNKNDALYCALLLSAPANTPPPPFTQTCHAAYSRSDLTSTSHPPSHSGHMLRPAGSSHMLQLATFRAVLLWHNDAAPPHRSPLHRLGRPNRPFILMKTTSSYSSLAFAAFFKGKKAAKQLRQRNGKTVKENGENWLLDTVNWQLPDGGGERE